MIERRNLNPEMRSITLILALFFLGLYTFCMAYDIPFSEKLLKSYDDLWGVYPFRIISVDLDTDGYTDIIYCPWKHLNETYWMKNTGEDSTFLPEVKINIHFPRLVYDLDGDHDMDLIYESLWYENIGFPDKEFIPHSLPFVFTDIFLIDYDKDNDIDILAVNNTQPKIVLLENNGLSPPTFSVKTLVNCSGNPNFIVCDDLDNDGDLDLVTFLTPDNTIVWYERQTNKQEEFIEHTVYLTNEKVSQIDVKDMNRDGLKDIPVIAGDEGKFIWYKNMGLHPPVFKPRYVHPLEPNNSYNLFDIKDLDKDGDLDILESGDRHNDSDPFCSLFFRWSENIGESEEGDPVFISHSLFECGDTSCINIIDLDSDNDLDILANLYYEDGVGYRHTSILLFKNAATLLVNSPHFSDISGDGINQPGEPGKVEFDLEAQSPFSNIVGTLISNSPYLEFSSNTLVIGDMNWGEKRSFSVGYTTSKSAECGDTIAADLHFSWDGNHQDAKCQEEIFGKIFNNQKTKSENPQEPIPDNDPVGLTRILNIPASNAITTKLDLFINIEHSLPGDLTVTLTGPNGNTVTVFHDPNFIGPNLVNTYTLNEFIGSEAGGDYTLHVVDSYPFDVGQLKEWSINVEYKSYQCREWDKEKILQYLLGYFKEENPVTMDKNIDQSIDIADFIHSLND